MATAQEAVGRVYDYLADHLSLEGFEDWSASYIQSVHHAGDSDAQAVAQLIRSILNAYEDDESEDGLRKELAQAIRPFVRIAENRYGDPSFLPILKSNADVASNRADEAA